MAVTARPPKKKFDDRPAALNELSEFIDESLAKFGSEDSDEPSPKERQKQREKEEAKSKGKKGKKKVTVHIRPKAVSTAVRPEPVLKQPPAKANGNGNGSGKDKGKGKIKGPPSMHQLRSSLLAATIRLAQEEYGDKSIVAAGEADKMVIGVTIPLAMQYVIQNNVLPLGRMIQLVGVEKSNKSSLGFEITRWFSDVGGACNLFENETKYSPDLAQSIFGWADERRLLYGGSGEVLVHYPCGTLQDWQQKLSSTTQHIKTIMSVGIKEKKGKGGKIIVPGVKPTGRIFPVLQLLDSIAGGVSEEKQIKMDNRGYAERDYAIEALLNQEFLKKFRTDLIGWPFTLLVVNHLKKQKAEKGGHIERKKPGGKHLGFQESLELEMSKIQSLKYVDDRPDAPSLDIKGNRIVIKCQKSALGEEERSVVVDLLWWQDRSKVDGRPRQYSQWQWEAALVNLLLSLEGSRKARAQEIVDLHKKSDTEIWSRRLGVSKEHPVNKQEIGLLLEKDPEIVSQLSDLFAIKQRTVFSYGDDYRKMLGIEAQKKKKKLND